MNQKLKESFNNVKKIWKDRTIDYLKQSKLKIRKEFNSLKLLQNQNASKFLEISREKLNNLQDKFEKSFKNISFDESLLKQSSFWLRSVTWTLIGSSSFTLIWLCFAKTEEVVVTTGKLDPKGDVKEIQIPLGGVIDEILVESGDNVESGQILVQLDKEASFEQFKSLKIAVSEKQFQLERISSKGVPVPFRDDAGDSFS